MTGELCRHGVKKDHEHPSQVCRGCADSWKNWKMVNAASTTRWRIEHNLCGGCGEHVLGTWCRWYGAVRTSEDDTWAFEDHWVNYSRSEQ
jgi:hypothetical protein